MACTTKNSDGLWHASTIPENKREYFKTRDALLCLL